MNSPKKRFGKMSVRSIVKRCLNDPEFRAQATRENHTLFFLVYLASHLRYPLAPFHKQILRWTEKAFKFLVIAAFRGAGKSTICAVSLALWLILGKRQKKFIILVARTQQLAREMIANIIRAIEGCEWLKRDLWPVDYDGDETRRFSIEFKKFNAKILAVSLDQSIRGIKFGPRRPDAIICDDLEDSDVVQSQENRDALHRRFSGEILPLGDTDTDVVVLGNTVHEDCLILRLGERIGSNEQKGFFGRFPILENGAPTWPGKFKSMEMIEAMRSTIGNDAVWRREYLLDPRDDSSSLVREEWMLPWDTLPPFENERLHLRVIGVDMAFSLRSNADYTAIVCADLFWKDEGFELYVSPDIVHERLSPEDVFRRVVEFAQLASADRKEKVQIFTEDMGAHRLYVDQWKSAGWRAMAVPLKGMSKEQRMVTPAQFIERGTIRFHRQSPRLLKRQIVELGIETHNDLADAFSIMVHGVMNMPRPSPFGLAEFIRLNQSRRSRDDHRSILYKRF